MKVEFKHGATRHVLLIGSWALKIPRLTHGCRPFLQGMLANMCEALWAKTGDERLCPVLWCAPAGLGLLMPKALPARGQVFSIENLPAENKPDSFGLLQGKLVLLDYGDCYGCSHDASNGGDK